MRPAVALPTDTDYVALLQDSGQEGSVLALFMWGFATVVAVVLGFAAWQYAPPRPVETVATRVDLAAPAAVPEDRTGSIAGAEGGRTTVAASRVIGAARGVSPMPLAGGETVATSRDIDQLRSEVRDLQRRLAQTGIAGESFARRIDRIEERLAGDIGAGRERLAAAHEASPSAAPTPMPPPTPPQAGPAGIVGESSALGAAVPAPAAPQSTPPGGAAVPPEPPRGAEPASTGSISPRTVATTPVVPLPPLPPADAKAAAAPSPSPSSAPAPVPTATPAAAAGPAAADDQPGVDLGGYRSLATMRRTWRDLSDRHAELGRGVEAMARLHETEAGMEVRLVAGPFASQADASKLCVRLKAAGAPCSVTVYGGQLLSALR